MTSASALPSTMKAIQCHEFVDKGADMSNLETVMTMTSNAKMPVLKKGQMLLRVDACSLSPGDAIMVRGNLIFLHPSSFPFVPGMDVCGKIVDTNGSTHFQNGDVVVASNGTQPEGGLAEYMAIDASEAVLMPTTHVDVHHAAASSSAITAWNAVMDHVHPGDRVLILGGAGGVGSAAIQLAKAQAKASFVAATSTQTDMCTRLGADRVIDYRSENWWEEKEWQLNSSNSSSSNAPFDVIIDTVGGGNFYDKATRVLKPRAQGGTFVAVTGDDPQPDVTTVWKAVKFFANLPLRPLYTRLRSRTLPAYVMLMPYKFPQGRAKVLELMSQQQLEIPLESKSPHAFTEEGVRAAFRAIGSRHAHGKVVVALTAK